VRGAAGSGFRPIALEFGQLEEVPGSGFLMGDENKHADCKREHGAADRQIEFRPEQCRLIVSRQEALIRARPAHVLEREPKVDDAGNGNAEIHRGGAVEIHTR
jgi:hypothetical protein